MSMITPPRRSRRLRPVGDADTPLSDTIERMLPGDPEPVDDPPAQAADTEPGATQEETAPDGDDTPAKPKTGGVREEAQRAAIIPGIPGQRWQATKDGLELAGYRTAFHGIRAVPLYTPGALVYAVRGAARLGLRWATWADVTHLRVLMSQAMTRGPAGHTDVMTAHKEREHTKKARRKLAGFTAGAAALLSYTLYQAPPEAQVAAAAAAFTALVYAGKPLGGRLLPAAILPPNYQPPSFELIREALVATIPAIKTHVAAKGDLDWVSDVHRDGEGWAVELDLPKAVTAEMIIKKRKELSSALRRPLSAVWPEGVPGEHEGRLFLWIGRHDWARKKLVPYPLLKSGIPDFFDLVPFGTMPRGNGITVPLFQTNWLFGGAMGAGKTAAIRTLLAAAALDTIVDLWTHEFSGKGDLYPFAQVSHRYVSGMDDEAIAYAAESVKMLRADLVRRQKIWKQIPREQRPEGHLTREIAQSDKRLRPIVAVFDECFPKGTVVGGRPIEQITVGDTVPSWDEKTGMPCEGTVTTVFKSRPKSLVRIRWDNGTSLVCTSGHPFMTRSGWLEAASLTPNTEVLSYGQADAGHHGFLHDVPGGLHARAVSAGVLEEDRPRVLLTGLHPQGTEADPGRLNDDARGTRRAVSAHVEAEPDGDSRQPREVVSVEQGAQAGGPWRERSRPNGTSAPSGGSAGLAGGSDRADRPAEAGRPAQSLQAGHREHGAKSGRGDRRPLSRRAEEPGSGQAQGRVAHWQGVDRVEVLESGGDGRYGGLCPDGHVYNIEVEGTHTYLVEDGLVVHNCHNMFQHPEFGKKIQTDLEWVERIGRAYGIVVILGTQRPGADSVPVIITAVTVARCCLKVSDHVTNDMILGTGSYNKGYDATVFRLPKTDAGCCWLKGVGDAIAPKIYYLNDPATMKIANRARAMREKAGVLSGYALGEEEDQGERSLLDDVRKVFGPDEQFLYWPTIAARLAESYPGTYTGVSGDGVSADVRMLTGAESDDGREPRGKVLKGLKLATLDAPPAPAAAVPPADAGPPALDVELLVAAAEMVIMSQWAAAETLHRKFRVGMAETGRLLVALEKHGVVGPDQRPEPREVLKKEADLDAVLEAIRGADS